MDIVEFYRNIRYKNNLKIRIYDEEYVNKINELDKLYYIDNNKIFSYIDIPLYLISSTHLYSNTLFMKPHFSTDFIMSFLYILELLKFEYVNKAKFIFMDYNNMKTIFFNCNINGLGYKDGSVGYRNLNGMLLYFDISNPENIEYNGNIIDMGAYIYKYECILKLLKFSDQSINGYPFYTSSDVLEENINIIENNHKKMKLCHDLNLNEYEAKEFLKLL